jgi:hypothetical protein
MNTLAAEELPELRAGLFKLKTCIHYLFKTGAWCVPKEGQLFGNRLKGEPGLIEYAVSDVWMLFHIWEERLNMQMLV